MTKLDLLWVFNNLQYPTQSMIQCQQEIYDDFFKFKLEKYNI